MGNRQILLCVPWTRHQNVNLEFLNPRSCETNTPTLTTQSCWGFMKFPKKIQKVAYTLRLLGMPWGVKTTCLEAPGVSLGGSGVSIGGVGSLRAFHKFSLIPTKKNSKIQPPNQKFGKFSSAVTNACNGRKLCLFFPAHNVASPNPTPPSRSELPSLFFLPFRFSQCTISQAQRHDYRGKNHLEKNPVATYGR